MPARVRGPRPACWYLAADGPAEDPPQTGPVCPKDAVVCENTYRDRTDDELRADFTARAAANGQQNYDFTTAIQAFCKRKYESDFSREMTRSAEVYLEDFRK